jgi:DNA-binding NtrC family response regulator
METDATERRSIASLPVRTIHMEVIDGPQAGSVVRGTGERATIGSADGNDLVLGDKYCSRYHLTVDAEQGGFQVTDHGSTNGSWVGSVRLHRGVVPPGTIVRVGATSLRLHEGDPGTVEVHAGDTLGGFRGRTPAARRLMAQVARAAAASPSVLIVGESGTGKEVLARALHDLGPRASAPFEVVDCGALVPALVASELFGHERGAFTGAERQHAGAFERAKGGTVFLDEIGELPVTIQSSLLGALERRRFRRVGGQKDIAVEARVVSATHRDLRSQVNDGSFRLDLYYRLAVVTLEVPPLRERKDDIPILVEHFLREAGHDGPIEELVSPAAMATLAAHRWQGNVRELRNMVEAMIAMGELPRLSVSQMEMEAPATEPAKLADAVRPLLSEPYKRARSAVLEEFERCYLAHILERSGGNVAKAARDAMMDRSHLIELLQKHRLR